MQDANQAILGILAEGTPELQIAAAQIIGELRPTESAVAKALGSRLSDAEQYLKPHLLHALAEIGTKPAIKELVQRIGDPSDADLVAHLLRTTEHDVGPLLCDAFEGGDQETRGRILEILSGRGGRNAAEVLEKALLDPELCAVAADAFLLNGVLEQIPAAKLRYFKDRIKKVAVKEDGLPVEVRAQVLRVYAAADAKNARTLLVKLCEVGHPILLREAALEGLRGIALTPTQAAGLLAIMVEKDAGRLADVAAEILVEQPRWTDAGIATLRKMLSSRRDDLRLFAIRAFRNVPSAEVVKTLVHHLLGDVPAMSEAASEALSHNQSSVDALLRALSHEKDVARARLIAGPLAALGEHLSATNVKNLLEKGSKALVAHDPIGEVYLEVLLAARGETGATAIVDKALRLRRTKKLPDALALLLFLATTDYQNQEARYQLALTRLLLEGGAADEHDGPGDATMGYFALLVREAFPVFERLKKENAVTPEALLRVGRHFAAGVGNERRFGADVLEFVADKHSKVRVGEEARSALRAGGVS